MFGPCDICLLCACASDSTPLLRRTTVFVLVKVRYSIIHIRHRPFQTYFRRALLAIINLVHQLLLPVFLGLPHELRGQVSHLIVFSLFQLDHLPSELSALGPFSAVVPTAVLYLRLLLFGNTRFLLQSSTGSATPGFAWLSRYLGIDARFVQKLPCLV